MNNNNTHHSLSNVHNILTRRIYTAEAIVHFYGQTVPLANASVAEAEQSMLGKDGRVGNLAQCPHPPLLLLWLHLFLSLWRTMLLLTPMLAQPEPQLYSPALAQNRWVPRG